jgi:hypothetical protein
MTSQFLSTKIWHISTCLLSASQTHALTVHMSILVTEHDKQPPSSFNVQTVTVWVIAVASTSGRSIQLIVPWQDDSSNWGVSNDTIFLFGIWSTFKLRASLRTRGKEELQYEGALQFCKCINWLSFHFLPIHVCCCYYHHIEGRDSSVGIATRYGLDGPGIESRWRRAFPHQSRPALRPTQPPIQWLPVAYRRGVGFGVFKPPPPKFRSFDKIEPDCKLSGKCLVFLFQHPN